MNVTNRLSEDVKIVGTLLVKEDLFIDCQLEGEIKSSGNLTVGENAKLKGEIQASNITVFGQIEGNLNSKNRCELKESSVINADISASTLKIVEGAVFNGRANVTRNAKPVPKTPDNPTSVPKSDKDKSQGN